MAQQLPVHIIGEILHGYQFHHQMHLQNLQLNQRAMGLCWW